MAKLTSAPVELARLQLPFPSYVDNRVLAGAAETITKPAGASWLLLSVTALCYINSQGAAIVPVADTGSGGGAPALGDGSFPVHAGQDLLLNVRGIAAFSIIGTAVCGLAWFPDHSDGVL